MPLSSILCAPLLRSPSLRPPMCGSICKHANTRQPLYSQYSEYGIRMKVRPYCQMTHPSQRSVQGQTT